mgnify:CR=1 FL=1
MCGKCSLRIFTLICSIFFYLNPSFSQDTVKVIPAESNKKTNELRRIIRELAKRHYHKQSQNNATKSEIGANSHSDTLHISKPVNKNSTVNVPEDSPIDTLLTNAFDDSTKKRKEKRIDWRIERDGKLPLIKINSDDKYTISRKVNLSIVAPGASDIMVSNNDDFKGSQWIPVCSKMEWILPDSEGYQRVYLKLLYPDSSQSQIYYDEIISDLTPPIAKFSVNPDSGIAGETIFTFNATESHHNFDIFLRWDWNGDGVFDMDWGVSKKEVFQYKKGGGLKIARLQVKTEGGWLVEAARELAVYARPEAKFGYKQDFENPLQIVFDATGSNDFEDGKNVEIRWDFNNDQQWDTPWSSNLFENNTFPEFQQQTIVLSIRDQRGL